MGEVAGGVVFEEVGEQVEAAFGGRQRGCRREIRTVGHREPLDAFDNVGPARKAARGEAGGEEPVLRRLAGVERLAHGSELRFEPGRLGTGYAERRRSCRGIEMEEPGAGRGSTKTADGGGRVETEIVMAGLQCR